MFDLDSVGLHIVWQTVPDSMTGMTKSSLTELGFQHWLPGGDWQTGGHAAKKMQQLLQPSRQCWEVAGRCAWSASGGIVGRQFAIFPAANVSASELEWCGPLALCQWWVEQRRSVHTAAVWWSTREGLRVQRCTIPVGWARLPWPDVWWLLHQQSDGFDAVASFERSNCWQHDRCFAPSSAHNRGWRQDLVRSWPAGWRHYRLKVSGQPTTTCASQRDCVTPAAPF